MIDKKLVHDRFAKNLESYNENAKIQKRMAERLLDFIKNKNPQRILEIGCGSGFLTKLVNDKIGFETYQTLDIVEDCQVYINQINPKIEFICDDIEEFLKNDNNKYDLIISNASLQWVNDFERVVNELRVRLNPNGELVFSTFGQENFKEIYHVIGATLNYYSLSELRDMFPDSSIEPEIHILAFESPKDVLKHLQATGVNALEQTAWTKKDLIKFENGYKNFCSRRPTLTYNPVYVKIISPLG